MCEDRLGDRLPYRLWRDQALHFSIAIFEAVSGAPSEAENNSPG